jgi:hypothetical protein
MNDSELRVRARRNYLILATTTILVAVAVVWLSIELT